MGSLIENILKWPPMKNRTRRPRLHRRLILIISILGKTFITTGVSMNTRNVAGGTFRQIAAGIPRAQSLKRYDRYKKAKTNASKALGRPFLLGIVFRSCPLLLVIFRRHLT